MALSEREQKVLDQLEELMHAEDPQFASSMSSTGNTAPVFSARHMVLGILCVLAGLGIVGFIVAAGGVYFATTSKKTPIDSFLGGKAKGASTEKVQQQRKQSKLMERLEERWDEREQGR